VRNRTRTLWTCGIGILFASWSVLAGPDRFRDVSAFVHIESGGFRADLSTGEIVQRVVVLNAGKQTLAGELYFVPHGLETAWSIAPSVSETISPGSIAVKLNSDKGKSQLAPGQQAVTVLRFKGGGTTRIHYEPRIYQKLK